jgi:hypothetical protein
MALTSPSSSAPASGSHSHVATRRILIAVELFLALNAIGGSIYAFGGAEGVDREWLDGTPFNDYVIPGVILLVLVGGSLAAAAIALLSRTAWELSLAAGAVLISWIVVETLMIGLVSWMQPATFAIALLIIGLALRLRHEGDLEA